MKPVLTEFDVLSGAPWNDGLERSRMVRLGPVVAIAGPNGSGKTRLLNRVERIAHEPRPLHPHYKADVPGHVAVVRIDSTLTSLQTPGGVSPQTLRQADRPGGLLVRFGESRASALLVLQKVANEFLDATHPNIEMDEGTQTGAQNRYEQLNDVLFDLLGTRLTCRAYGDATLFGRSLDDLHLSQGQTRIVQFVAALFEESPIEAPTLIIMDEPENHLHPRALIAVLDAIQRRFTNGQFWIATHSIALLAQLDSDAIWYMENGVVEFSGTRPLRVLQGLLGSEQGIERLSSFLSRPAQLALERFAVECIHPPGVVDSASDDPQLNQICRVLCERARERPLTVLDYGAGVGRLATALAVLPKKPDAFPFSYYALESTQERRSACVAATRLLHEDADARVLRRLSDAVTLFEHTPVDVVVMCNVLHEIPIRDWPKVLRDLAGLLGPLGAALIVEDLEIPHGELPNVQGFVLLDEAGVRALCGHPVDGMITTRCEDPAYRDRLVAHLITRDALCAVSVDTLRDALELCKKQAAHRIEEIRLSRQGTYKTGRLLALHLQHFASASLALEHLMPSRVASRE